MKHKKIVLKTNSSVTNIGGCVKIQFLLETKTLPIRIEN